jgi:hypothetical protein
MKVKEVTTEQLNSYGVGRGGVINISYHTPMGDGDRHFCDIEKKETTLRLFSLYSIEFEKEKDDD